jgi:peptidoglycan/LPS O-acetylase OafA/YrhL
VDHSGRSCVPALAGPGRQTYFPGLDGLRAVAVLGVMLYHFGVLQVPGRFLGVDVFFVLSGYLITGQLWARWSGGCVEPGRFWAARIRRLFPAVLFLLAVTTAAMVTAGRDQLRAYLGDLAAAGTYTSNWWYIVHQRSYFEATGRPPVLQHLWSLAVEEQFYLVWPLVIVTVLLVCRSVAVRRRALLVVAALLAAGSAYAMWRGSAMDHVPGAGDPSRWYFGTDSHSMGLLVGAVLALWRSGAGFGPALPDLPPARLRTTLVGAGGLAAIGWTFASVDEFSTPLYRFGFAAVALVTAVVVAVATRPGLAATVLGWAPLRVVGQRSYGLYLWHWPVVCFTRPGLDVNLDGWRLLLLRFALTVVLTETSYRFVEQPVRRLGWREGWRRLVSARLSPVLASVTAVVVGLVAFEAVTPPPIDPTITAAAMVRPGDTVVHHRATPPTTAGTSSESSGPATTAPVSQPRRTMRRLPTTPTAVTSTSVTISPAGAAPSAGSTAHLTVAVYADSVALGAEGRMAQDFGAVINHATVGEQAWDLLPALTSAARVGQVPGDVVLLHTGDNGVVSPDQLQDALAALAGKRTVVLVVPRVPRPWEQHNLGVIRAAAAGFRNVRLADWYDVSTDHPEYFVGDGIHLSSTGVTAYTRMVRAAVLDS